jgi:hypothetical protein
MAESLVESCESAAQMLGPLPPAAHDSARFLRGTHQVGMFDIEVCLCLLPRPERSLWPAESREFLLEGVSFPPWKLEVVFPCHTKKIVEL